MVRPYAVSKERLRTSSLKMGRIRRAMEITTWFCATVVGQISWAQVPSITPVSSWGWAGYAKALASYGDTLLVGRDITLSALDVSNLSNVRVIGEVSPLALTDIQVRDTLGFVCSSYYLRIMNLSRLDSITELGSVQVPGGAERAVLQDSICYVLGYGGNVAVVDWSNPRAPRLRGHVVAGGINMGEGLFAACGRVVYVQDADLIADGNIVNASNLDSLYIARPFNMPGFASGGIVQDTLLAVLTKSRIQLFYSIAQPLEPVWLSELYVLEHPRGAVTRDSLLYVSDGIGINVLSVARPASPRLMFTSPSTAPVNGVGGKLVLTSRYAVAAYWGGLSLTSLGNGRGDSLREVCVLAGIEPRRLALSGGIAYAASGRAGLWIADVRVPAHVKKLALVKTGGTATDLAVSEGICYLAVTADSATDSSGGLWVIDVQDPARPQILAHHTGIGRFRDGLQEVRLTLSGKLIALALSGAVDRPDSLLEIVNVTDPKLPVHLASSGSSFPVENLALQGTVLALATLGTGVHFLDVSDLAHMHEVGELPVRAAAVTGSGHTSGDSLWYVVTDSGLAVVVFDDLSGPRVLGLARAVRSSQGPVDISASSGFVYWADSVGHAVDVRVVDRPVESLTLQTEFPARSVAADGPMVLCGETTGLGEPAGKVQVFLNDRVLGLHSADPPLPTAFSLDQNYPNPFNSSTLMRFSIPRRAFVSLAVYDVLGRRVAELLNGASMDGGTHVIRFDATHLASGLYLCRLHAEDRMLVRKMLLLK